MSNYIEFQEFSFSSVTDSVKTEANAFNLISKNNVNLKENIYIGIPLADIINKLGLKTAQSVIDRIESKIKQKKIFVCQHIFVNKLNFYNNTVFTPHAELSDSFKIIPHYNLYFKKQDYKEFIKRKCLVSFLGALNSHPTRMQLKNINSDLTPILDTGSWHFEKQKFEQEKNSALYKKLLVNSKFSLCPRGTGANTIRFYESISIGSIPIIFNDIKVPIEIKDCVIRYDINNIRNLTNYLETVNNAGEMSQILYNFYWNNYDNNIIHKLIESHV